MSDRARAALLKVNVGRKNPEQIARLAELNRGKKRPPHVVAVLMAANRGRKMSPEHKERLRLLSLGRVPSPEARAKMSAAHKGRPRPPETREKIAAAHRGRVRAQEEKDATRRGGIARVARVRGFLGAYAFLTFVSPSGFIAPRFPGGKGNRGRPRYEGSSLSPLLSDT